MSFPDVGRLVTPEEVVKYVGAMNNTIGVLETLVIESVEDMVEDYCGRKFELQEFEDEQYFIRNTSVVFDQVVIAPRLELRLKNRPVTEFTVLKTVSQRDDTTGEPVSPQTIPRSFYTVDFQAGIVKFKGPLIGLDIGQFPILLQSGFLSNPEIELLATYEAGYDEIPKRLKGAVLMIIQRIYKMTTGQSWHLTQSQTTGQSTVWQEFIRNECGLTPEEKLVLDRFKTPVAA